MLKEQRTFTISECARILGVTPSWLRFGERLGSLPLAQRTQSGWRYYTWGDIERLRRMGVGQRPGKLKSAAEVGADG